MKDHTPVDVEKIIKKAKNEDQQAMKAKEVIDESLSSLDVERNNSN